MIDKVEKLAQSRFGFLVGALLAVGLLGNAVIYLFKHNNNNISAEINACKTDNIGLRQEIKSQQVKIDTLYTMVIRLSEIKGASAVIEKLKK